MQAIAARLSPWSARRLRSPRTRLVLAQSRIPPVRCAVAARRHRSHFHSTTSSSGRPLRARSAWGSRCSLRSIFATTHLPRERALGVRGESRLRFPTASRIARRPLILVSSPSSADPRLFLVDRRDSNRPSFNKKITWRGRPRIRRAFGTAICSLRWWPSRSVSILASAGLWRQLHISSTPNQHRSWVVGSRRRAQRVLGPARQRLASLLGGVADGGSRCFPLSFSTRPGVPRGWPPWPRVSW